MGLGGFFKAIGRGVKKLHESDNPVLKGIRDFGDGMADAPEGSSVNERLASGGIGVGGGIIKGKLDPEAKPGIHERKPAEQDKEPVIDRAPPPPINPGDTPPIFQNDIEERRKRSAIMRGLRMNQLDTE